MGQWFLFGHPMRFVIVILAMAVCLLPLVSAAPPGVEAEKVFGPETATGKYKHPASITELANGDLYLAYYGGDGEYAPNTGVYGSRLKAGERAWSSPVLIAKDPFYSLGNAVVWQAPDGLVWLFYVIRFGETWTTSRIAAKISRDGAETWPEPSMVTFEEGTMVRGRPIVLSNGDYLLPIYDETGHHTEFTGPDTTGLFLHFNTKTDIPALRWRMSEPIRWRNGVLQPAVVELEKDHLVAFCRPGGGFEARTDRYVLRSESHDGGWTWTRAENTEFPNSNTAVDLLKLRNGHLLLVYNDSMTRRIPLTVAISSDGGRTFTHRKNIAEGADSYAYPYAVQARDGKIHVVATSERRTVIARYSFDESAVLGP